jgi:tripartite ATP-independent transporter DctM subunit
MNPLSVLLLSFALLLALRCPIAVALFLSSLGYLVSKGLNLTILAQTMIEGVDSQTLLAVPLYILVGELMNTTGITNRVFNFALALMGHVRGGLGHVNVLGSMIFAGISGSSTADVAGLGRVEIKAMEESGYRTGFAAAITAASSIIGPIIPPSIHMVIYGAIADVSVASLFLGGVVPGILMGVSLMAMIYFMARTGREACPVRKRPPLREIYRTFKQALFPILAPLIIVGSLLLGIGTPTESGAIAVAYVVVLGLIYRELTPRNIIAALQRTVFSSVVILFILATSRTFAWALTVERVTDSIIGFILTFTDNKILILLFINVTLLILGCFETATANLVIITPILVAVAQQIGIDLVHLGVMVVFNLVIGIITPPVGTSLYIVADITKLPFEVVSKETLKYIPPLLVVLGLITYWPQFVLFIPKLLE